MSLFFHTKKYEKKYFEDLCIKEGLRISFFEPRITSQTACLADNHRVVCSFVNDDLNESVLKILKQANIELIALRSAGFNHVDLKAAESFNLPIVRVPSYSPISVAEHAVCLLLSLNRKIH